MLSPTQVAKPVTDMNRLKYLYFCASTGPIFLFIFILFWGWLGQNIPPLGGDLSAETIASVFREKRDAIRLGMVVAMSGAVLYLTFGMAIAKVIEIGIETNNDVLSKFALWGAGLTVVPVLVSCSFWLTGSYRPDALPDAILQMLYDMAWLLIDLGYMVTTVQLFAMGVAFLSDKRSKPLIPKWFAWYGIWVGFMFIAECIMPFFYSGPFARQGLLNFYIEFGIWFVWLILASIYIFAAIGRLRAEARALDGRA